MDAVAIIVVGAALIVSGVTNFYLAYKYAGARDAQVAAAELAAQRTAEAQVDARKVDEANAATTVAINATAKQQARGDVLEKELTDETHEPGTGVDRLRVLSEASAAVPDPGPGAGSGGGGSVF